MDSTKCEATSRRAATCAYGDKISAEEAAAPPKGTWCVSVPTTAKDGRTSSVPKAAHFTVEH